MLIRFSVVYLPLKIFSSNLEKSEKKIFFLPSRPVQSPQSGVGKHYKSRYLCVRRYDAMFRVFSTYRKVKVKSL